MARSSNEAQSCNVLLLVEDDDNSRAWLCELMIANGYEVLPARHGFDALLVAAKCRKTIDLLITDLDMPVMDGRRLARIMVKQQPDLPLLFMSGRTLSTPNLSDEYDSEVVLIQKPFDGDAFLREVRQLLPVATDQNCNKRSS